MLGASRAVLLGSTPSSTTYTFLSDNTNFGSVGGHSVTYSSAQSGVGATADSSNPNQFGQDVPGGVYYCYEGFIQFDTSSIPDSATITSVTFSLYVETLYHSPNFTANVRLHDWGATLTNADFIDASGSALTSKQLLASKVSTGISTGQFTDFVSDASFPANVNKTGSTRVTINTSELEAHNAPAAQVGGSVGAYVVYTSSGTNRPKLVVVTA